MKMKTLEKILSVVGLAGALAACGADNGKESCTKDTDCREPRVCDSDLGYCVDANGSSGSSSGNPQGYCGNSPLYGKYLWFVGNCEDGGWGSAKPFDENCKGNLKPSDDTGETVIWNCNYEGLTLTCTKVAPSYKSFTYTLTREVSSLPCSSVSPNAYVTCEKIQCYLAKKPNIYYLLTPERKLDRELFGEIASSPFTREICVEEFTLLESCIPKSEY
ncbi:MAG: hypothetical protein AB1668_06165 [Nanoarchaeota archaeon]